MQEYFIQLAWCSIRVNFGSRTNMLGEAFEHFSTASNKSTRKINRSIVQGSGIGPKLNVVVGSDLKPLSSQNDIFKFADDGLRSLSTTTYNVGPMPEP